MKNIGLLLVMLSVMSCVDNTKETEEIKVVETVIEETTESGEAKLVESSALIDYALEGNLEGVKTFVESGENINVYTTLDYNYRTALKGASENGHLEIVKYLVEIISISLYLTGPHPSETFYMFVK